MCAGSCLRTCNSPPGASTLKELSADSNAKGGKSRSNSFLPAASFFRPVQLCLQEECQEESGPSKNRSLALSSYRWAFHFFIHCPIKPTMRCPLSREAAESRLARRICHVRTVHSPRLRSPSREFF